MKLMSSQKHLLDDFLLSKLRGLPVDAVIGEFNCAHSVVRSQLGPFQEWFGVDTDKETLKQIKAESKSDKVHVRYGVVNSFVDLPDNSYDLLLCPLQLQDQKDLSDALQVLQAKVAFGGKVVIVELSNAEKKVKSVEDDKLYLHSEKQLEQALGKLHGFSKQSLGASFVVYEWVKV